MTGRFTVLASGSSGNAALLETNGFGFLIDCGLPPRMLSARLREVGASWDSVNAVILTHTHGDHWKDFTLAELRSRRIPLYAHADHLDQLGSTAQSFDPLKRAGLARSYGDGAGLELAAGLVVRPVRVSHDSESTYAFRIDRHDAGEPVWSVGYASDLGCGSSTLIDAFAGVDVLALEFNHDERMERNSRRPRVLIDRVLSDCGHLSNEQAGELAAAIAARSGDGFPGHLVQLHLSRHCNRPELASEVGHAALSPLNARIEVITARQDAAARSIPLARRGDSAVRLRPRREIVPMSFRRQSTQPSLPGFEGE
jgi:phosphoribosyl 1,2-cyclic phosphodiesterase